ncbi:hypothetical protein [Desulfovibrio sp. TomC]|uniref:hypothetical protein n=1 Tax=Desulfovibrio sp. TomC TaxID=1562888 RepID=UPI0012E10D26|nr:hypothetical protein [Desulfovibrio sp. TomC]
MDTKRVHFPATEDYHRIIAQLAYNFFLNRDPNDAEYERLRLHNYSNKEDFSQFIYSMARREQKFANIDRSEIGCYFSIPGYFSSEIRTTIEHIGHDLISSMSNDSAEHSGISVHNLGVLSSLVISLNSLFNGDDTCAE